MVTDSATSGSVSQFHDYTKDFKVNGIRYGWSYTDFDSMMKYFNLSKLPDYDNAAEPYIAYILMSRPSLCLENGNFEALRKNTMSAAFTNDLYGESMLEALGETAKPWLPVFTTKAMSYSVNDFELKTVEKGNTYYGHMIKYGKHSEDHKIANTISIDFRNDRYLSILKMVYLWMVYIYLISKNNVLTPSMESQQNGIIDYAGSIYYLVTRRNGSELVYWEKLVGVYPIRCPFSIFSSSDTMILEDKFTIDFQYSIKADPCDPSILMDINFLSGDAYSTIENKTAYGANSRNKYSSSSGTLTNEKFLNNKESPFVRGDVYATNPYITVKKDYAGRLKYYLQWEG